MLESIKAIPDRKIIKIIEKNLFEQIRYYGRSPGSTLIENSCIIKLLTDIPLPFFNCVLYYNYDKSGLKTGIRDFVEYGREKCTSLLWLKSPSSVPQDIESVLTDEGFKYDDHMFGMAVDISNMNSSFKKVPGLKIEVVDNSQKLSDWILACLKGFDENGKNYQAIYDFEHSLGYNKTDNWIRFTGIIDSSPVATSAVFMGSESAGLDNVTTVAAWRKKGIGALMVKHALGFAQSRGYNVGVLQASDMGISLYRYLGFREFAESKEYIWKYSDNKKIKDKG